MDFHVLSVHTRDGNDGTPLQLISVEQLEHYQAAEAELDTLKSGGVIVRWLCRTIASIRQLSDTP